MIKTSKTTGVLVFDIESFLVSCFEALKTSCISKFHHDVVMLIWMNTKNVYLDELSRRVDGFIMPGRFNNATVFTAEGHPFIVLDLAPKAQRFCVD